MNLQGEGLTDIQWGELEEAGSYGLSTKTWGNYKTAKAMINRCFDEKNLNLDWPMTETQTLTFIHWLRFERNLKATSITNYLSGLKHYHMLKGHDNHTLRTGKINLL